MITDKRIDGGKGFDWGKTSSDYAKYRDIYPQEMYKKLVSLGICVSGQQVLDLGTGTGVLPRNMYPYGAHYVGTDISKEQIEQAKTLAEQNNMDIQFICTPSESIEFPDRSFDVVTACQCFFYFDHDILAPKLYRILKQNGKLVILYMACLPKEDTIAGASEKLILEYNPSWSGCNETRHPIHIPEIYNKYFKPAHNEVFDIYIPFTRDSWNGRIKACRGVGASLDAPDVKRFEEQHTNLLLEIAQEEFNILHYCAICVLEPLQMCV